MRCKDEVVKVLDSRHLVGTSKKSGKPYDFHTLVVGDEMYNKFEVTVDKDDLVDGVMPPFLQKAIENQGEIVADFDFTTIEGVVKIKMSNVMERA